MPNEWSGAGVIASLHAPQTPTSPPHCQRRETCRFCDQPPLLFPARSKLRRLILSLASRFDPSRHGPISPSRPVMDGVGVWLQRTQRPRRKNVYEPEPREGWPERHGQASFVDPCTWSCQSREQQPLVSISRAFSPPFVAFPTYPTGSPPLRHLGRVGCHRSLFGLYVLLSFLSGRLPDAWCRQSAYYSLRHLQFFADNSNTLHFPPTWIPLALCTSQQSRISICFSAALCGPKAAAVVVVRSSAHG